MEKKYKIKHKKEGWTGKLEITSIDMNGWSSHNCYGKLYFTIYQDAYDKNGKYHEDPHIEDLDELEIIK